MFKISKVFLARSIKHFLRQPCIRDFATNVCSLRQDTFDLYSDFERYGTVQAPTRVHGQGDPGIRKKLWSVAV